MDAIYLDSNATTPLLPAVWEAMRPYALDVPGNPASAHRFGRHARRALDDARERLAALLDAHPDEVVLTSGGTEANNHAVYGLAGSPPAHLLASAVEHLSVVEPLRHLARAGFAVDWLPVDARCGLVVHALRAYLRPETRLVATMLANHETGAVQPIADVVQRLPSSVSVHCDAVQAVGKMPVSFRALGVTTLALTAHKFHGPRGIGALLVRRGAKLRPLLYGGHQQAGRRPGTEPVALAVGMTVALEIATREREARRAHLVRLRAVLLDHLRRHAAPLVVNGPEDDGLPHTLNVSFPGLKADLLLMNLDLAGVACSTGSACSSGSLLPSPVLQAMGVSSDRLHSALRFSLHPLLSEAEVGEAARRICRVVQRLRQSTPAG
ncbi:MAG: cysteine desulfurase family protein [Gemmataceae bacterium]